MKIELITAEEAKRIGLTYSKLLHEGHGAFGEPDNSFEDVVYIGQKTERLSENDFVLFCENFQRREVIQIINEWNSSDKLLEVIKPEALIERKKKKYKEYLKLKKEIETDEFYILMNKKTYK